MLRVVADVRPRQTGLKNAISSPITPGEILFSFSLMQFAVVAGVLSETTRFNFCANLSIERSSPSWHVPVFPSLANNPRSCCCWCSVGPDQVIVDVGTMMH